MCKADIFNEIIQIVSRETEIAPKVILSGSKEAEVVDARYLLVYFLFKEGFYPSQIEKGHLCRHISQAFGIDPYGEEAQYLSGYVGQKMFPVAKKFLCEHCINNLIKNHG